VPSESCGVPFQFGGVLRYFNSGFDVKDISVGGESKKNEPNQVNMNKELSPSEIFKFLNFLMS
jgi:hypothetical protein